MRFVLNATANAVRHFPKCSVTVHSSIRESKFLCLGRISFIIRHIQGYRVKDVRQHFYVGSRKSLSHPPTPCSLLLMTLIPRLSPLIPNLCPTLLSASVQETIFIFVCFLSPFTFSFTHMYTQPLIPGRFPANVLRGSHLGTRERMKEGKQLSNPINIDYTYI